MKVLNLGSIWYRPGSVAMLCSASWSHHYSNIYTTCGSKDVSMFVLGGVLSNLLVYHYAKRYSKYS